MGLAFTTRRPMVFTLSLCVLAACASRPAQTTHDALTPTAAPAGAAPKPEQSAAGAPWLPDAPNLAEHFAVATAHACRR